VKYNDKEYVENCEKLRRSENYDIKISGEQENQKIKWMPKRRHK